MDILKVFVDEPFALEPLASEPQPRGRAASSVGGGLRLPDADSLGDLAGLLAPSPYARAYLAGSRLPEGDAPHRVGLTTLHDPALYVAPLLALAGERGWSAGDETTEILNAPGGVRALVASQETVKAETVAALASARDRDGFAALKVLLDTQPGALVLVSEPAPDGYDWTLYARSPLRSRLVEALASVPGSGARRLVMPFQKARGEHRFYLERWALDDLPDYVEDLS